MAATKKTNRLDLSGQVHACLTRHFRPGARLRLALSGGVDSVVLLHLLAELAPAVPFTMSAMHVHHGLNPKADAWAAHCQMLCDHLNITYECVAVKVPRKSAAGLEASARKARYAALTQPGADVVVLAHHLDDQAETVLFQLLRGGEPRALAAMPEMRLHERMPLLRPLLNASKSALMNYAHCHQLAWVEDDSNADTTLSRNALRQDIFPLLEKHFPDYRERLSGVAQRMAEVAQLLEGMASADKRQHAPGVLNVAERRELPEARARNLLAHFLREHGIALPRPAAMRELLRQLLEARGTLDLLLPDGHSLNRTRGKISVR